MLRMNRVRAFTLIELLVVVAIIALLISILLPSLQSAREKGRIIVCATNERTLAMASFMFAQDDQGRLPPHATGDLGTSTSNASKPFWDARLVPYVGGSYDPDVFACPTLLNHFNRTTQDNARTYRINGNITGYNISTGQHVKRPAISQIKYPSRTVLFSESFGVWSYNTVWGWNTRRWQDVSVAHEIKDAWVDTPWGPRPAEGGSNFSFVDGHVQYYNHTEGWPNNRVANLILVPGEDL